MDINMMKDIFPILLKASVKTIQLTVITVVLGSLIGIIVALLKLSKIKIINLIASFYTWIIRGTPMLLQLIFFYYGLPFLGIEFGPMGVAIIGLSLNSGAYMGEIIRGGILSIDKGQFEACKVLGFTYTQTMRRVILPQTVKVLIPPVGNEFITILKDTSLVSSITIEELMKSTEQIYSSSFKPMEPFFIAACIYLALTTVFTGFFSAWEKKVSKY